MSSHTIVCLAGKRLQVKPSPTSPGMVLVQILSADRAVQASVTVDPAAAGVLSLAFELEGREAERLAQSVEPVELSRIRPAGRLFSDAECDAIARGAAGLSRVTA